eukprot:scaffold104773_cov17-Tisochrysis_lutea.AAC.4
MVATARIEGIILNCLSKICNEVIKSLQGPAHFALWTASYFVTHWHTITPNYHLRVLKVLLNTGIAQPTSSGISLRKSRGCSWPYFVFASIISEFSKPRGMTLFLQPVIFVNALDDVQHVIFK